jgi:hypothetical protein
MPAFTLYGSRGSTNTDRVRLTLAEGGFTDYELVLLNLQKGEQKVCDLLLHSASNFFTVVKYLFPFHFRVMKAKAGDSVRRAPETSPVG